MRTFFFLLILILGGFWVPQSVLAKPQIKVDVTPKQVKLGESVQVRIRVIDREPHQAGLIEPPDLRLPPLDGFELISQSSSTATMAGPDHIELKSEAVFQVQPVRTGTLTFPSLTLTYRQNGQEAELKTDPVTLQVAPTNPPLQNQLWGLVAFLALAGGIILAWRWRRQQMLAQARDWQTAKVNPAPEAPHKLERLDEIQAAFLQGQSAPWTLDELYFWFQSELEKAGYSSPPGATTAEILACLESEGATAMTRTAVADFLKSCETLRYSGAMASQQEILAVFDLARKIAF